MSERSGAHTPVRLSNMASHLPIPPQGHRVESSIGSTAGLQVNAKPFDGQVMTGRNVVESAIAALLKPHGYKKRRSTWHRLQPEAVLVVNVQKSEWGPSLYVDLGVYLRGLGRDEAPPEHKCHLRTRLDRIVENRSLFIDALDLEARLSSADRERIVGDAIVQSALPWLEARENESKARATLLAEGGPTGLVMAVARKYLGIGGAVEQAVAVDDPAAGKSE